jgi:hypothetical protein
MVQPTTSKRAKSREIPKLIKKALAEADLTKKLNESALIASPMNKDMASRIEELCQLPTAATLPPADNNTIPPSITPCRILSNWVGH